MNVLVSVVEAVRVHLEHAVRVLLEVEREGVELLLRAEPDVPVLADVERRLERVDVLVAHLAAEAVAGDHEVGPRGVLVVVVDLDAEAELDAELDAARR